MKESAGRREGKRRLGAACLLSSAMWTIFQPDSAGAAAAATGRSPVPRGTGRQVARLQPTKGMPGGPMGVCTDQEQLLCGRGRAAGRARRPMAT